MSRRNRNARSTRRAHVNGDIFLQPTPERRQHDEIEFTERPFADDQGRPSMPFKSVDILYSMQKTGAITAAMRQAGDDFRTEFAEAHLNEMKAMDLAKPYVNGGRASGGLSTHVERARTTVWAAIMAVGGLTSLGGSCIWHVVGMEMPLRRWAIERAGIHRDVARGILIGALCALQAHFNGEKYRVGSEV